MTLMRSVAALSLSMALAACSGASSNIVGPEKAALAPSLAPLEHAATFAQIKTSAGRVATLLVTHVSAESVQAVDLTQFGAPLNADVFDVLASVGRSGLQRARADKKAQQNYPISRLLSAAGPAARHVATATNFREHAREAEIEEVFNFPKFGRGTPPRTTVVLQSGALLDYEVEICARFDRDIRSIEDFDAARKGFFLCGDFTDRARLMRMVNTEDLASGQGFSDAKSGVGFFPTGPFLVVPDDWRMFVRSERMTTKVNRELRQDARGGEMILDFRAIVEKALTNGGGGKYTFKGSAIPLLTGGTIARGAAVMSGTSEGVVFRPPQLVDYVSGGGRYIFTGPMLRGGSAQRVMIEAFIEKERRSGRYLRSGDLVTHTSSSMGDLKIKVTTGAASAPVDRSDMAQRVLPQT